MDKAISSFNDNSSTRAEAYTPYKLLLLLLLALTLLLWTLRSIVAHLVALYTLHATQVFLPWFKENLNPPSFDPSGVLLTSFSHLSNGGIALYLF